MGLTAKVVKSRVRAGRLVVLHRGVYAVGHARLTRRGEWLAAVLAAGPGAVLSHRSAAALHGLREERGSRVDVATPDRRLVTNWVEVHGRQVLPPADVTVRGGIACTTVARTLVDLADLVAPRDLARAVNEADVLRVLDVGAIVGVLGRMRGRRGPGTGAIRAALEQHHGPALIRSELEHRFRELLVDHVLPPAEHNVPIEDLEVDAVWRDRRLVIELDSDRYHRTPAKRRRDAAKERTLRAAGWRVERYDWIDITDRAERTAGELHALLATT